MMSKVSLASTVYLGKCCLILHNLYRKSHAVTFRRLTVLTPRSESRWWRVGDDQGLERWQQQLVSSLPSMKEVCTVEFPLSLYHWPPCCCPSIQTASRFQMEMSPLYLYSMQFLLSGSAPHYGAVAVFTNGPSDPARGETSTYFRTSSAIDPGVKSALRSGATVWKCRQVSFPRSSTSREAVHLMERRFHTPVVTMQTCT